MTVRGGRMRERVAVCGLGLLVPGREAISAPDKFWELLMSGQDAGDFVPGWKWCNETFYDRDAGRFGKTSVARGNFVAGDRMADFDAAFFRLSPNEARAMDPQHRCALKCSVEALWDAQIDPSAYAGRKVDVVVGMMHAENQDTIDRLNAAPGDVALGHERAMCANRVSSFFDFRGRSLSVDTACSSSMQALDLAVEGLQQGQSEMGVVVGVNYLATPYLNIALQKLCAISPDGTCKFCDAAADGYGRGEAVVAIVLKRLSDAVRDGNTIYCTIVDTMSNHDGAKDSATYPSQEAQQALMERIYSENGLDPKDTQYLEAHGAGTYAGDKTELAAVHAALIAGHGSRTGENRLVVGSVKTQIGHTEGAAGACSLAKAALMLYHKKMPGSLHLTKLNPEIPLDDYGIVVPQTSMDWPTPQRGLPRRMSINSFGLGGSNTHVILEEFVHRDRPALYPSVQGQLVLPLSAHTKKALAEWVAVWVEFLKSNQARFLENADTLKATMQAAIHGRSHLEHRICILGDSVNELTTNLEKALKELEGMEYPMMGAGLYRDEPVFKATLDRCSAAIQSWEVGLDIVEELHKQGADSNVTSAPKAMVLIPALQIALTDLLCSKGIKPAGALGYSSGEVAAAYCAGALSLESAMWLAHQRSLGIRMFGQATFEPAALAVDLSRDAAASMLGGLNLDAGTKGQICISAIDSPLSVTLSGDKPAIEVAQSWCSARNVSARVTKKGVALNSHHMAAAASELTSSLDNSGSKFSFQRTNVPLFSTVTGACVSGRKLDSHYWGENLHKPVDFNAAVLTALSTALPSAKNAGQKGKFDAIVELGPHPALWESLNQILASVPGGHPMPVQCPMHQHTVGQEAKHLHKFLGDMYVQGHGLNWKSVFHLPSTTHSPAHWIPRFPFQEQHLKFQGASPRRELFGGGKHNLLGHRLNISAPTWQNCIEAQSDGCIADHKIEHASTLPGAAYIEMALAAVQELDRCKSDDGMAPNGANNDNGKVELTDEKSGAAEQATTETEPAGNTNEDAKGQASGDPAAIETGKECQHYWVLRDVSFHSPLALEGALALVQTTIVPQTNTVQIHSAFRQSEKESPEPASVAQGWQLHFSCQYSKYPLSQDYKKEVESHMAVQKQLSATGPVSKIDHECLYNKMDRLGYRFGPALRRCRNIWRGSRVDNRTDTLYHFSGCDIQFSVAESTRFPVPYNVPPSVLDAAFNVTLATKFEDANAQMLPVHIDKFMYFPPHQEDGTDQKWIERDFSAIADEGAEDSSDSHGYSAFAETQDGVSKTESTHDISLMYRNRPVVLINNFMVKRISEPGADEVAPLDRCLYTCVWEAQKKAAGEGVAMADRSAPTAGASGLPARDRTLLVVSPNPEIHPWIRSLRSHIADLKTVYSHGVVIMQSIKSLREVLLVFASNKQLAGGSDSALACQDFDLMYVCEPVVEEVLDMVHMLDETRLWLDLVLPQEGNGQTPMTDHHAFFVSFGGNADSPCPGVAPVMGFGRTLQTEHALEGVKCSLVDMEPLETCPADKSFQLFYEQVFQDQRMHDEFELAIRNDSVILPRLKRLDFKSTKGPSILDSSTTFESATALPVQGSVSSTEEVGLEIEDAPAEREEGALGQDGTAARELAHEYSNYCMKQEVVGDLNSLHFEACEKPKHLDPRNAVVQVQAVSLNYKDALLLMGEIDASALEGGWSVDAIGVECSGIITEVGSEAPDWIHVGDRVIASPLERQGAFQKFIEVPGHSVTKVPDGLDLEIASGLAVAGGTAHACLNDLAHLEAGETVLIHSAAGGVGTFAVQIAHDLGATVIATASTPDKADFLRGIGADYVFQSRTLDFVEDVRKVTDGRGVDVVLNSLSGRATQETMKLLAPFGRFVEIGKRDIMERQMAPMQNFVNNGTYHVFDMDRRRKAHYMFIEETLQKKKMEGADGKGAQQSKDLQRRLKSVKSIVSRMAGFMTEFIEKGWIIPTKVYDAQNVTEAFKQMLNGDHIGKLCIRLPPVLAQPHPSAATASKEGAGLLVYKNYMSPPDIYCQDETYIIVGGTSGLGLEIAWTMAMSMENAYHICLISRSGGQGSAELARKLSLLKRYVPHKNVQAFSVDVTDEKALEEFLESVRSGKRAPFPPTIGGIIHSAVVLMDQIIRDMSGQDMVKALEPKVRGAYLLHKHTIGDPLRFFVTFSSIASLLGAYHQANYAAANSYLEGLVRYRRGQGLPGLCLQWGAIADTGGLARDGSLIGKMSGNAPVQMVTPPQCLSTLFTYISTDAKSQGTTRFWAPNSSGKPGFLQVKGNQGDSVLYSDDHVVLCAAVNWRVFEMVFRRHAMTSKFVDVVEEAKSAREGMKLGGGFELVSRIEGAGPEGGKKVLADAITATVAELSGHDEEALERTAPFSSFGLTTGQLSQLKSWAEGSLPVTLSTAQLSHSSTIDSLSECLIDGMMGVCPDEPDINSDLGSGLGKDILDEFLGNIKQSGDIILEGNNAIDPDLVAFVFLGIDSPSAAHDHASKVALLKLDKVQVCLVRLPYCVRQPGAIDWTGDMDKSVVAIRRYMTGTWNKHKDDALTLPFVFIGEGFGALVATEIARRMQVAEGPAPVHLAAIHAFSPQVLARQYATPAAEASQGQTPQRAANSSVSWGGSRTAAICQSFFSTNKNYKSSEQTAVLSGFDVTAVYRRMDKALTEGWNHITSGKVTFAEEEHPNPARLLKELLQAKRYKSKPSVSWIDEIHNQIEELAADGKSPSSVVEGKWEALTKMGAVGSTAAIDYDAIADLEASSCLHELLKENRASSKVKAAINEEASKKCMNGWGQSETQLDKMLLREIQKKSEAEGCVVVQISAFEAPTRFQRLPLWPYMCEGKVEWVDIAIDPMATARSARVCKSGCGYRLFNVPSSSSEEYMQDIRWHLSLHADPSTHNLSPIFVVFSDLARHVPLALDIMRELTDALGSRLEGVFAGHEAQKLLQASEDKVTKSLLKKIFKKTKKLLSSSPRPPKAAAPATASRESSPELPKREDSQSLVERADSRTSMSSKMSKAPPSMKRSSSTPVPAMLPRGSLRL
ncbi:unnamed protein product [Ostreobium quekettii]|uniref:Polyketide synthase n=1 Tax=Ostreobium quekettii TaxID=121088 RepID=A0A8S1J4J2_9CHLO|nr:unnamed protein product [Ostreobium quekettii]